MQKALRLAIQDGQGLGDTMTTDHLTTTNASDGTMGRSLPKIKLLTMLRLGLFQMGLGIMSLLTLGVLNRIMIDELKVIPFIAATAIAMHQFVSPARVWFGQLSDSRTLWGHHRTGFVWMGAALFTCLSFVALQVVWQLGLSIQSAGWSSASYAWAGLLAIVFAGYGLALSASSTPFAALLVDITDEDERPKLIGVVWSMLMVGIVIGAIISGRLLTQSGGGSSDVANIANLQATINPIFILLPATVFGLCILATFGIEKKYSRLTLRSQATEREDQITLKRALKILTASRQTGVFFIFLLVMTISLFMQDSVMEPYGGEVFNLSIAETTKLNVPFGMGTLIGIASSGFLVVPRLGKQRTTGLACLLIMACLVLIILSGFTADPKLLRGSLFFFGLAAGMLTAGATSLMLDLTAAETAGTFIGAWGLAQAIARGLATLCGGFVLSIGKAVFSQPVLAYSSVFGVQIIGLLIAIILLQRINIREFQASAKQAIASVIASDLD
jgi:MFS transporter, BCD family, chlorophyll transporter